MAEAAFKADNCVINSGMPLLSWEDDIPFSAKAGDGSVENPFQIATADDLELLNKLSNTAATSVFWNSKNYILTADIDMSGKAFDGLACSVQGTPSGGSSSVDFSGTIDGNGHIISNLNINSGELQRARGFISYASGATVKNLGIVDSTIRGQRGVGAIIGHDKGGSSTVSECYVKNVTITDFNQWNYRVQGGIVGQVNNTTIINCYSTGVTGYCEGILPAGIAGRYDGANGTATITNCYTTSSTVYFDSDRSGNKTTEVTISNCYSSDMLESYKLGYAFSDNVSINDGLPVLKWQIGEPILSFSIDRETARVKINCSYSPSVLPAVMVISAYDSNNMMTDAQMIPISIYKGNTELEYDLSVSLNSTICGYIWNDFSGLKIYSKVD